MVPMRVPYDVVRRTSRLLGTPLFRNTLYIILTSIATNVLGLLFWLVAARAYTEDLVGTATAVISSVGLFMMLSRVGLDQAIIRYMPTGNKGGLISVSALFTSLIALALAIVFILGIDLWAEDMSVIRSFSLLYLFFVAGNSITSVFSQSFVAVRKAQFSLFQNLIVGASKLALVYPLAFLGVTGIVASFGLSYGIALVASLVMLAHIGVQLRKPDFEFLRRSFQFSGGNYASTLLMSVPPLIFPILILNLLDSEVVAQFYISFSIASVLFVVPLAFGTSLFVEGSYGEPLRHTSARALLGSLSVLTPLVIGLLVFGQRLLDLFGGVYSEAFDVLRLLTISSYFVTITYVSFSAMRVRKDMIGLISWSALLCAILLGLGYTFLGKFGLDGIGYAWIIGYGVSSLSYLPRLRKGKET